MRYLIFSPSLGKPLSTCAFDVDTCLPLPWLNDASDDAEASTEHFHFVQIDARHFRYAYDANGPILHNIPKQVARE
jgi:hypothetical protein